MEISIGEEYQERERGSKRSSETQENSCPLVTVDSVRGEDRILVFIFVVHKENIEVFEGVCGVGARRVTQISIDERKLSILLKSD